MRVLVCGGRKYDDWVWMHHNLDRLHTEHNFSVLIQGEANGADRLAKEWAQFNGIETIDCPADWDTHKKAAGMIRNRAMLDDHKPDLVVAFPGGIGTAGMISYAKKKGVRVEEIPEHLEDFQIDTGFAVAWLSTNKTGIIKDSAPIFKRWIGKPLNKLIQFYRSHGYGICTWRRLYETHDGPEDGVSPDPSSETP